MYKKLALTLAAFAVVGGGLFTTTKVFAQTPASNLVTRIAEKFGLNQSDVQAVFDQNREQRQAEMQAKFEERLTQFVSDGKITEAQKQLIIAKHKELQGSRQAGRVAMQEWATQNGIDINYMMGGFGMRGGHMGGMGRPQ